MNMISRSVPRLPALQSYRPFIVVRCSWLRILEERLQLGHECEFLRTLDQGVRGDLGLVSNGREEWRAGEARKEPRGLLREVFSWTRFSK
jgi:hypothetical protein